MKPKKSLKSYIYERDERKCRFCSKHLKYHQASLDHYLPKSQGGTNDVFNLILSCKNCNNTKKSSVPDDYEELMINLFKIGVRDRVIKASLPRFSAKEIDHMVESIDRLEAIDKYVVFQSKTHRLYIKNNSIKKIVYIGSNNSFE
ncbi:MAG: HNH endonuclease [Clostridiales bacterium]|jgi:CRISPR/Cas system Type II protein with McrA/HNH and RuvC-like nuclease domain|nr:HNH endonuclease [Clostridiales bacterium]